MLSVSDLCLIVFTTAACTAAVSLLAWGALHLNRRGSIASQFVIVTGAAVVAVAVSTIVVLIEMLFSEHDLTVLAWLLGVAALMSMAAAWLMTTRVVRRSTGHLLDSTRRIADGHVVDPENPGWREFAALSEELADTSRKLADARAEITRLDAARREFFVWISHDLRTPMAGIRALAEAMEAGVAERPVEYSRQIRERVDAMGLMVDDLFALARIESGTLDLRRELVDLLDLVSDAVSDVQHVAAARGIRIEQRGVEGHTLWGDPRELTRAISNLLANGIRHAPDHSEILVSATTLEDGHLVLSILDHGSGVSTEDLGRMFDVGWRGDAARTAEPAGTQGGAGLGLAIVRGIVKAHGGDVSARLVSDGFCLDITLPTESGR
ncbi:sensor histidine kinase [Mycetocola saprophilus]|uniref:sensor histidine kinase n=1 Tax=Mycetocola saprophilus TaxID=76636 RepID=UPI003BF07686